MVDLSTHITDMMAVFLVVSLAAERVVQVLKNSLRVLKDVAFVKSLGDWLRRISPDWLAVAPPANDEDGNWAKLWPRVTAVLAAAAIAKASESQILPLLVYIFPNQTALGWWQAGVIGLFSAAGSDLWSQLIGTVKELKRVKQIDGDLLKVRADLGRASLRPGGEA